MTPTIIRFFVVVVLVITCAVYASSLKGLRLKDDRPPPRTTVGVLLRHLDFHNYPPSANARVAILWVLFALLLVSIGVHAFG